MNCSIEKLEQLVLGSCLGEVKVNDAWRVSEADCHLAKRHLSSIAVEKGVNLPINVLGLLPSAKERSIYSMNGLPGSALARGVPVVGMDASRGSGISPITEEIAAALLSNLYAMDRSEPSALFGDAVDFLSPSLLWVKRIFSSANNYVAVSLGYYAQK